MSLWSLPLAYHFFSRFPVWRSPGPVWRTIQWLLYAVFVLVIWPAWVTIYLGLGVSEGATRFMVAHPSLYLTACQVTGGRPLYVYMVVCFVLSLVVTARNYQRLPDPDSRRRIQWVIAGATIRHPFRGSTFVFNIAEWGSPHTYTLLSAQLSRDAVHSGFDRGGGLEGATVRYPRARPPRASVSVCKSCAPRASRASDCVAGVLDLLESQPHHRSDRHSGFRLAERRLDRRHRRDAPLEAASSRRGSTAAFSARTTSTSRCWCT